MRDISTSDPQIAERLQQLGVARPDDLVALIHSPDDAIALDACWLLGQVGSRRHSLALTRAVCGDRPALWMQSAISLSLLDSKRPTRHLIALMCDPQRAAEQRYAAAYALAFTPCALKDPRVRPAFMNVLRDRQSPPNVRGTVAEGLGNIVSKCFAGQPMDEPAYHEAGQLLITTLRDPEPEVRFWSAFALGKLGYHPALPELRAVAATDTGWFGGWWTVGEEASDAIDLIEGREPPERVCLTKEQALQQGRCI